MYSKVSMSDAPAFAAPTPIATAAPLAPSQVIMAPPTPAAGVVLQSETVLKSPPKDGIHEGQVSLTHGFVPSQPISASLPPQYEAWENLSIDLPRYISEGSEREHIKKLPLLDVKDIAKLPNEHLSRAIAIIGNFAHAYYFNQRLGIDQQTDPLPASVLQPWQELTKRINRKLPPNADGSIQAVRIHYDTFLTNWNLKNPALKIDGTNNDKIALNDLAILSPIFGNGTEYNFNMTFVIMELRFAAAIHHMNEAIKASANKNDDALLKALKDMTTCVESLTEALDYINPNQHSEHYVDPTVWTKTVAKIDGKIPGGISGLSGSAMPLFHALDTFIERRDYSSTMGKAMANKYKHQPQHIQDYLSGLRADLNLFSIRKYIENSKNPVLKSQYDLLIDAYLGENGLMGKHTRLVYGYMKINFRNGRLQTNGGHDGTSTIATEPQRHIYDDFADADLERLGDYRPTQQYATKIRMSKQGDKAASIDLDVTKTALNFQPGDHCAIHPENSNDAIQAIIKKNSLAPSLKVKLNKTWQEYFSRRMGKVVDEMTLEVVLQHADLTAITQQFKVEALAPLAPRYYSVAPLTSPQHIRLIVGTHNAAAGKPQGLCSTYLMSDTTKFAIERIPARHFHLPKAKDTPILMFAAGTGISPFMGFISERSKTTDKSKNMLFVSTPSKETLYQQDELAKAVKDGKLDLSVIFSKGAGYDTGAFTADGFKTSAKYQGKHVDQLIAEQAKKIADLVVNHQAQIYICGNPGFADTVRAAIISALSTHGKVADAKAYVDTMMADFRFNSDVFSGTDYTQQFRSIPASEIAAHNKTDDCWGIINGSVYNLTRFIHTHPGGHKIVMVNAGIDMSGDYNYIKHNKNPQIEAQLQQYKIGVVATPVLRDITTKKLHDTCKKMVEALTEMENTLRNNTTYPKHQDKTYLWREVYSVFVSGSLASYRKAGSGNAGSLSYVVGPLLKELGVNAGYPTDSLEAEYGKLIENASTCGEYIRQSSTGALSESEIAKKKPLFDMVLQQTFKFINELKGLSIDMLKNIEGSTDNYDKKLISDKLDLIVKAMKAYSWTIKHINSMAPQLNKVVPLVQSEGAVGCVFADQLRGNGKPSHEMVASKAPVTSNAAALSSIGLMAAPKPSVIYPDPTQTLCTII